MPLEFFSSTGFWTAVITALVDPAFMARHPKPGLPDELRADIAPETVAARDAG